MATEIRQFPQRDTGTGFAKQIEEPVTYSDPGTNEPTGAAKQQNDEVVYEDLTHTGKPTGFAEQAGETTTRDAMTVALEEAETKARTARNKARTTKGK